MLIASFDYYHSKLISSYHMIFSPILGMYVYSYCCILLIVLTLLIILVDPLSLEYVD